MLAGMSAFRQKVDTASAMANPRHVSNKKTIQHGSEAWSLAGHRHMASMGEAHRRQWP